MLSPLAEGKAPVRRPAPRRMPQARPSIDVEAIRRRLAEASDPPDHDPLFARMKAANDEGRAAIRTFFEAAGDAGVAAGIVHRELARLTDAVLQGALDHAARHLYPLANPTRGEEMAVLAVGGYGRGEMAPGSDVDLLFVHPYKRTAHIEQMAEFLVPKLWDLRLKVGQAMRSIEGCIRLAATDVSVRTSMLETRLLWGSGRLVEELDTRLRAEVFAGHDAAFIEAKLAERDARHARVGDSRYLLEPNVKEGKGGLRDLHTLMWLGRFIYGARKPAELVAHGVLTRAELGVFMRSRRFLWTVRCHLHYRTGRPQDRLTFDLQPIVARAMGFGDRRGSRGVERFMKRYYLAAKDVGVLTRIVCAALEEQHKRKPRFSLQRLGIGRRVFDGFEVAGNRLGLAESDLFVRQPRRMLELFHLAQARDLDIHPAALAAVAANLKRIDAQVRADPHAHRLFLEMLTSRIDPVITLTRMNDTGVIGRLYPDFGKVVALMQHDLYHVYTVDEHTIRAIGVLHQIEQGELGDELPLTTGLMPRIELRTELYVATFLHDIGKGRGGDHSEIGARIARRIGPLMGLSGSSTETVEWLVRHHLLMSAAAFKRDLDDPKTIQDFVAVVQSPERLRLLLVLTVADIRAVGPTVWNGWKGQLLRELFHEAEAVMASGDPSGRRQARVAVAQKALREALAEEAGWPVERVEAYLQRHDPRYWLGVTAPAQRRHAAIVRRAEDEALPLVVDFAVDRFRARTELTLYTTDHPGLFMKLAGALSLSGVSIVDAHIFTTTDGMALDTFGCQDADGRSALEGEGRLERIAANIEAALEGRLWLEKELAQRRRKAVSRTDVFTVTPRVLIDDQASRTHTIIEINGRDRPGLLFDLAKALKELGLIINSAHISTYGERVVDVFYVKDVFGLKIMHGGKQRRVREHLLRTLEA
ncbi:MAG: [protein-PII] uridylyltransferase [Geminicoccaceae bacterium]|nr:[protein-PII] uridylyltransferase [Geminicoccaceae bacterium]